MVHLALYAAAFALGYIGCGETSLLARPTLIRQSFPSLPAPPPATPPPFRACACVPAFAAGIFNSFERKTPATVGKTY